MLTNGEVMQERSELWRSEDDRRGGTGGGTRCSGGRVGVVGGVEVQVWWDSWGCSRQSHTCLGP